MTGPDETPSTANVTDLLKAGDLDAASARLSALLDEDEATRKRALQELRDVATANPGGFEALADPLAAFLTDEARAVRLTTAKAFVALASEAPAVVRPVVESLAARVSDDDEFYYVRARCAEALGYVGLDHPEAVSDPETLAEFRVGLSFDEPEVREKLAKALAYVALGDPSRLKQQVASLAEHLDDERELVRYHLCTALVVVGCEHPERLAPAVPALAERATDEDLYVRGRAAEALGLYAATDAEETVDVHADDFAPPGDDDVPGFLSERLAFLRARLDDGIAAAPTPDGVGSVESVREGTADAVEAMTSPDSDEACPACGLELPEDGPPMCPRCGAPH
ncbi:HEAT repeat domain-containing protein [Halorubellus salinus]|uniref:HEAT repeat domain-containing protein n=1 Tax=Halorubellus salinus TaxID=755309 RepID=UPI001D088F35|nr:HEAT repeat domain-containing protein [Halorubellus salinus]